MPQRRFHAKSRRGCLQCKKNRTKCDEKEPKCGRCERIGIDCSLAVESNGLIFIPAKNTDRQKEDAEIEAYGNTLQSSYPSNKQDSSVSQIPTPKSIFSDSTEQPVVGSPFTETEKDHLRLMSHYALNVSKSITEVIIPKDQDQSIWSHWVTELALENDFLLHGILSISALHLALSGIEPKKFTFLAIHHHGLGVALFRPQLSQLTARNHDPVFSFSLLVMIYSFGIQRSCQPEATPIARIHQLLLLVRGSSAIVKFDLDVMRKSRWGMMMLPYPFPTSDLTKETEEMLLILQERANSTSVTARQTDIYITAIEGLRSNLMVAVLFGKTRKMVTLFPVLSPIEFWPLVASEDPLALAIVANYAVILYWYRDSIWVEGWGKGTVDAVREVLPPEWQGCIAWSVQQTEGV